MFIVEELFLQVDEVFNKGDFAGGKKILEEILDLEPGYGRAHNHLGWLYYAKFDEYEKAIKHFQYAIKFAPEYPPSYLNYTYILNYLNRHQELVNHVNSALKIEGANKATLYNELGKSYETNGFYKEAEDAYLNAIKYSLQKEEMGSLEENLIRVKEKTKLFSGKKILFNSFLVKRKKR